MIITNYYINAGISILCLVVGLLHLHELDLIKKDAIKKFRFLAFFIIAEIAIDTLFKSLEGVSYVSPTVLYVIKAIEFALNPVLPYLVVKLFENNHNNYQIKWILVLQVLLIFVNIALEIGTVFGKYMFYIDEANQYKRTDLGYIYTAALVLSTTLMILALYILSRKTQSTNKLTLYGLYLILIAGFALKTFFSQTNYDWLSVSIAFFVIDIYYVNLALRLDPLTSLLNRQVYSSMIEKINFSTAVIMIDANSLKKVNDSFGHECGDKTLQSLARCIRKAYSDYGWCFRIGGDEFCVILKPEAFIRLVDKTPRSDVYLMIEELMKRLDSLIKLYAEKNSHTFLQYGASQGYGIYYSPIEYPSILDHMPIDKVIKLADERMYLEKNKYKQSLADNSVSDEQKQAQEQNQKRPKIIYESANPELIEGPVQE